MTNSSVPARAPLRVAAVAVEAVLAVVLVVLAYRWWQHGVITRVTDGIALSRVDGRWWAASAAVATVAGVLLLNAGNRVRLAIRGGGEPGEPQFERQDG